MFELFKSFRFEAGHVLPEHKGKCCRPHGHSYKLVVKLRSKSLETSGPSHNMVIDFADVAEVVEEMIEIFFDHHWLNETLCCDAPTAEFIARWIYLYLKARLPLLTEVTLQETASAGVSYSEELLGNS